MASTLDGAWVDSRLQMLTRYLDGHVKAKWSLFEPTAAFYAPLESGEDEDLAVAAAQLCDHISLRARPAVTYEWGLKLPMGSAGLIRATRNVTTISIPLFYVGRPAAVGAILAHEITHAFLFRQQIPEAQGDECEPLTDLTAILLGLGKVLLNGIDVVLSTDAGAGVSLGYLGPSLVVHAHTSVLDSMRVGRSVAHANLNESASMLMKRHASN